MKIRIINNKIKYKIMGFFDDLFGYPKDVKVEVLHGFTTVQSPFISNITVVTIELKITNNSGQTLYIENPRIKIPIKINGETEFYLPAPVGLYPFQLLNEKVHSRSFTLTNNIFDKLSPDSRIRFIVKDTLNNKYFSEKYKVSELTLNK